MELELGCLCDAVTSGTIKMESVPQFLLSVNHSMRLMVNVLHVSQAITWPMENVSLLLKTSARPKTQTVAQLDSKAKIKVNKEKRLIIVYL